METVKDQDTQRELTPEELAERREELLKFYTEELPLLEKRAEYEELVTRIEEAKFARFQIQMAKAQILSQGMPEEGPFEQEVPQGQETGERKLKVD